MLRRAALRRGAIARSGFLSQAMCSDRTLGRRVGADDRRDDVSPPRADSRPCCGAQLCAAARSLGRAFYRRLCAPIGRWAAEWALMIVAMMFPLLVPIVGHVAARSFAPRRDRSVGLFIAGYVLRSDAGPPSGR